MNEGTLLIAVEEARDQLHAAMEALQTLLDVLNDKIRALEKKQRYLEELKVMRSQRHDEIASSIIKVNIRGTIFEVKKDILTVLEGSYFDVMLSVGETTVYKSEASVPVYFIDRSYEGFERIISNMRGDSDISWDGLNVYEMHIVRDNLEHFNVYQLHIVLLEDTLFVDEEGNDVGLYDMVALFDGRLCSNTSNGDIVIIDIDCHTKGKMVLTGHIWKVYCLALLHDGRLCSASEDESIKIWNTSTGQCDMTLPNINGAILGFNLYAYCQIVGYALGR